MVSPVLDFGLSVNGRVLRGLYGLVGLLVGGASRQGKSVFLNSLICSLISAYSPSQVELCLMRSSLVSMNFLTGGFFYKLECLFEREGLF